MKSLRLLNLVAVSALFAQQATVAATVRVACSGGSGDAAAINTAIVNSAVGDEIVIETPPTGVPVSINQTISLREGRTYRGESRTGTILKQANGVNLVAVLASAAYLTNTTTSSNPITVHQLSVDGNLAGNLTANTVGIILRNHDSAVDNVRIYNMRGDGIRVSNPSANGTALTTTMNDGLIQNCFIDDVGGHGISVKDTGNKCIGWEVIENWITDCGASSDSINVENGNNWTIDRNHLYGVPRNGIVVDRAYAASISNNYMENFGETTTTGTYSGVKVSLNNGPATDICNNHIFRGGTSASSTYTYIRIDKVNSGDGVANVFGNVVNGVGTPPNSTGLTFNKGSGLTLTVNYKGNLISNVVAKRSVGLGATIVSQESGL